MSGALGRRLRITWNGIMHGTNVDGARTDTCARPCWRESCAKHPGPAWRFNYILDVVRFQDDDDGDDGDDDCDDDL
jgi:hypothetical protein